jgi:hypothetical protein
MSSTVYNYGTVKLSMVNGATKEKWNDLTSLFKIGLSVLS